MRLSILLAFVLAGCGSKQYTPVVTVNDEIFVVPEKAGNMDTCMENAFKIEEALAKEGLKNPKARCGVFNQKVYKTSDTTDYDYRYRWIGYNIVFKEVNSNECKQMKQAIADYDMGDMVSCAQSPQLIR